MKRGFALGTNLLLCVSLFAGCGASRSVTSQAPTPDTADQEVDPSSSVIDPGTSLPTSAADTDSLAAQVVGQALEPGVPGPVKQVGAVRMPDGTQLVGSMLIADQAVALVYRTSDRTAILAVGSTLKRDGSAQPTFLIEGAVDVVLAGPDAVETLGANCTVEASVETAVIATVAPYEAGTIQAWAVSEKAPYIQRIDPGSVTCTTDEIEE